MKSDLLKIKLFLPPSGGGLRWGGKFIPPIPPFHEGGRRFRLLSAFLIAILLFFILIGCNESGGGKSSSASTSRKLFVVNSGEDRVSVFDIDEILEAEPDENGDVDVAPIRSIGSKTGLSRPQGIFIDTINNEIFAANTESNTITVYDNDSTKQGNIDIPPKRTIRGDKTNLSSPISVFIDTINNEIFVANSSFDGGSITVYDNDRTRTGEVNVSPIRIISGVTTGLLVPRGIFVDAEHDEIYVADFNGKDRVGNILVFDRNANVAAEEVRPIRTITILETTDEGFPFVPTSVYVDVDKDELFTADFGIEVDEFSLPFPVQESENLGSTIKVYRRTDTDTGAGIPPSPLRTIRGPGTGLLNPLGIFVDNQRNEIFAVNFFNNTVTVYENDRTKTGDLDMPPLRTLFIRDTNSSGFTGDRFNSAGIFVDTNDDEIFVVNQNNTITVYKSEDVGDAAPRRTIGPRTGLLAPEWIHVDSANGEIFVSNALSQLITVYGITDEGNTAPLRTIPQGVLVPKGISVDTENDVIFVAGSGQPDSVRAFRTTDGAPLKIIFGSNTGLGFPEGLYLDTKNDEIFVANLFDSTFTSTITVYDSEDSGNASPLRTIKGANTGLSGPNGVFVDTEHDEIFVANSFSDTITVYENDRTKIGDLNIRPKRTIKRPDTRILGLRGVFVDTKHNLIFVTNSSENDNSITVYENDRSKTGDLNIRPMRTIRRPKTGLSKPIGLFVTESP